MSGVEKNIKKKSESTASLVEIEKLWDDFPGELLLHHVPVTYKV